MDSEKILRALNRHSEIKKQIQELQNEDAAIIEFINRELEIDIQTGNVQKTQVGDYIVSCTVPQNIKVNMNRYAELCKENPELRELQVFRVKYELDKKTFNDLPEDRKNLIGQALTITPGKTQIDIKNIGE